MSTLQCHILLYLHHATLYSALQTQNLKPNKTSNALFLDSKTEVFID